jgi:hypothetical protein
LNLRNNQNIQALALVAVLVAALSTGIAFLMPQKADFFNLDIQVTGNSLSIAVPHCDMSRFQDRFFMHIYQSTATDGTGAQYVGRDFALAGEPRYPSTSADGQCVVQRSIDVPDAKKIVIGQFTMPDGRCCNILWSRTIPAKR